MATKALILNRATRSPTVGPYDDLHFKPGVNVLTGLPNTGKSQWLRMIDYMWGDTGKVEDAFEPELAEKYDSLRLTATIGTEEFIFERFWKQAGLKSKVVVNGKAIPARELSDFLLQTLDIPQVHFPQGDPYSSRSWPELSWRSLYRHIYRRQDSWNDIANRQPEGDQHACLALFLGIAGKLYPTEYKRLVQINREIHANTAAKEQFYSILNQLSGELLSADNLSVAVTPQSLKSSLERLDVELSQLHEARNSVLNSLKEEVVRPQHNGTKEYERLDARLISLRNELDQVSREAAKARQRTNELSEYEQTLRAESLRLRRAMAAGAVLSDLKVTHCPVCDRSVNAKVSSNECYLCHQPRSSQEQVQASRQRLQFELDQVEAELSEAEELVSLAKQEDAAVTNQQRRIADAIRILENELRPVQQIAASLLPPDVALLDNQIGQLTERRRHLERVEGALALREDLASRIRELEVAANALENKVKSLQSNVAFESIGDHLADSMNTYLNALNKKNPNAWTQPSVSVQITKQSRRFYVGNRSWTKLGGTLTLFFLLSYNYALLSLSHKKSYHYPGLFLMDLPARFEDGTKVADAESFVLEPFIDLLRRTDMHPAQVIAAGTSFSDLEEVNRIVMDKVWK